MNSTLVYQLKTLTTQIPNDIIHYLILCRYPPIYIPQEYRSILTKPSSEGRRWDDLHCPEELGHCPIHSLTYGTIQSAKDGNPRTER